MFWVNLQLSRKTQNKPHKINKLTLLQTAYHQLTHAYNKVSIIKVINKPPFFLRFFFFNQPVEVESFQDPSTLQAMKMHPKATTWRKKKKRATRIHGIHGIDGCTAKPLSQQAVYTQINSSTPTSHFSFSPILS